MLVLRAFRAPAHPRSNPTAMLQIPTAATVTMRVPTMVMERNMGAKLSSSFRASLLRDESNQGGYVY